MDNFIILDKNFSTTRKLTHNISTNKEDKTILQLPINSNRIAEGGLRTKNFFKKNIEYLPLITIVTVVYNGINFLETTIQSVLSQTYQNVEYIIIDGGSTDGTIDIIRKYENYIDYWISEKDKGIYDAMNKGIDLATGEWINFMNAGDCFYNNSILEQVFYKKNYNDTIFLYGNTEIDYGSFVKSKRSGNINNLQKGMQFSHQSIFIKSHYHKKHKYNINNKIIADFEFFYKSWLNKYPFHSLETTIATVSTGGVSDIKRISSIWERWKVVGFRNIKTSFFYILLITNEIVKKIFKSIIGKNMTIKITALLKK